MIDLTSVVFHKATDRSLDARYSEIQQSSARCPISYIRPIAKCRPRFQHSPFYKGVLSPLLKLTRFTFDVLKPLLSQATALPEYRYRTHIHSEGHYQNIDKL